VVLAPEGNYKGDTHGFLVLTHAQAGELARKHGDWMRKYLDELTPGLDGFSGLSVPGHEDAAPDFERKRKVMDDKPARRIAGAKKEIDNYAQDLEVTRRGELDPAENVLWVRVRQERAAWIYFALAVASALATVFGVRPQQVGTGWVSVLLLAAACAYYGWIVTRMRRGWRAPFFMRFVPAAVLLVLVFSGVPGLTAG
jgi:hypothetical protein